MNAFLKSAYENFWVPYLGRALMIFSGWIEGKPIDKRKQTFDLRDKGKPEGK